MYKGRHIRGRKWWVLGTAAAIAAAVLLLLIPFIEPYRLEVEQVELESAQLPAGHTLWVVFVSDIRMDGWPYFSESRLQGLVNDINRQRPDLVLLGGDYTSSPEQTAEFFRNLPPISATLGVYAVLGEADRPADEDALRELGDVMRAKGITLLVNEVARVPFFEGAVRIAGLDDALAGRPDMTRVSRQVTASEYVILLAHNPSLIESANRASDANGSQDWFDLALFGHTHGNQFFGDLNPLGIGRDVAVASHRKGWIREGRSDILVSRGVGTVGFPVRLGCAPQIHCIGIRSTAR